MGGIVPNSACVVMITDTLEMLAIIVDMRCMCFGLPSTYLFKGDRGIVLHQALRHLRSSVHGHEKSMYPETHRIADHLCAPGKAIACLRPVRDAEGPSTTDMAAVHWMSE